ncbi:outer membrane protein assembly factor BamB family protein [Aporhodopirellula aestuarii]|uniref:PQQ-like beta-propeller repeat protein n=1 Tax=Aporhodopirellula aestuarii TaxID=2950107 RepID=A0ABT0U835_9BACT|nr:PQQ-binding-like beta-propeller repeat protein [Aporhodopirellula aestuarii]MCM2373053.1 PQQ-like beta-propeller repeat protein [Aporhodopirellula aestuarii]
MNRVLQSHSVNSRISSRGLSVAALAVFFSFVVVGVAGQRSISAGEPSVLSPNDMERVGLVQAWRRLLSVPAGTQSIVDHTIVVHNELAKQFVEVVDKVPAEKDAKTDDAKDSKIEKPVEKTVYARYLLEVPDAPEGESLTSVQKKSATGSMLDRMTFGGRASFATSGLLNRAEAERRARNDIRRLKLRGIDAEISSRDVPAIRMYTLSDDGTVECRDAETGEIVWLRRVGDRVRGYRGLGVDDKFLTVVNGSDLIKMDVVNGEVFGVIGLRYVPMRGPRHCGAWAVIPSVGGRVVGYPLDNEHRDVFAEIVSGDSLSPPALAMGQQKLAWGTSKGFVYVMEATGEPEIQFRLNTDGVVGGAPAAAPGGRFFFGSAAGQIYGLRATRSGEVIWSRPTGDPIFDSPIFFDEKVLFLTTYGNLMCVEAGTGNDLWDRLAGGISKVLGVIGDRIYASSLSGALVVLDAADGHVVHQVPSCRPEVLLTNIVSDRLYLIDQKGAIQCLRHPNADMPTLPAAVEPVSEEEEEAMKAEEAKKSKNNTPAAGDPFGDGAVDPFGGGGADPFGGGGADPFGGGGAVDPFAPSGGGGADPFGGF